MMCITKLTVGVGIGRIHSILKGLYLYSSTINPFTSVLCRVYVHVFSQVVINGVILEICSRSAIDGLVCESFCTSETK